MSYELHRPMRFDLPATVAAAAAEIWKFFKVHPEIGMQLIRADIADGTGLGLNGTNYTTISIYNATAGVAMASASNQALAWAADTWIPMTLSATTANTKAAANADIEIRKVETLTGAAWSIPGTISSWWLLGGTYN